MDKLSVQVENMLFTADDNTYCVFRASNAASGKITVVYRGPAPFLGEDVELEGKWVRHPRFGEQFQASICRSVTPTTISGMEKFLASGVLKGVGPAMAARIVEQFGTETLNVFNSQPERLREVSGIGKKKAQDIMESYAAVSDLRELMIFLEEHGLSGNYAPRLQALYGGTAITRIENNPYCLATEVEGIGFKTADKIARSLGIELNDEERIRAGLSYALTQAVTQGHTCVPEESLLELTADALQIDYMEVRRTFDKLIQEDLLRTEEMGDQRLVYPEYIYQAETSVAHRLLYLRDRVNKLWQVDYQNIIRTWERQEDIELAEEQVQAIKTSAEQGVFVLTGGPGTGKTTVVKGILSVLEAAGCKILLAAPTGRAARRLTESAGAAAATVHRLLEYTPNGGKGFFGRNGDTPLEADAVIVDEASMLDISLMHYLLQAIPIGCRLILVGDVDQLPSVGPGSVLQDIIRSKVMPVVRLENIFRQREQSSIVTNAHRINRGLEPNCEQGGEFVFVPQDNEETTAAFVVDTYAQLARGQRWQQVQVLTPMHKNPCGVRNLNKLLQARMNPPQEGKGEIVSGGTSLRVGDKIMQIRNNYDKDVFNGDLGLIKAIFGKTLVASFPDRPEGEDVSYDVGELEELQLAYAMSVHKSQGSEYDTIIMPLVKSHYVLLQRNLLYTGVTRAKKRVILTGNYQALSIAVHNDRTRKRYSLLAERLQETWEFE